MTDTGAMLRLRTRKHLSEAPALVGHVLDQVVKVGGSPGPKVSGTRDLPIPVNATALEDANQVYASLVNWSTSFARALKVLPPSIALGWYRRDQDCDGLPSWSTPADAHALTFDIAQWLIVGERRIESTPSAALFHDDIHALFRPLHGRYRRAPHRKTTAADTCPACDRRTLIVNFTTSDAMIACTYCGHEIPPAAFDRYLEGALITHEEESEERDWLTVEEAAEHAEVSVRTIRRYAADGLTIYGDKLAGEFVNRLDLVTARRRAALAQQATRLRSL